MSALLRKKVTSWKARFWEKVGIRSEHLLPILASIYRLVERVGFSECVQHFCILRIEREMLRHIAVRKFPDGLERVPAFRISDDALYTIVSRCNVECAVLVSLNIEHDIVTDGVRHACPGFPFIGTHDEIADGADIDNVLVLRITSETQHFWWLFCENFPCFSAVERAVDAETVPAVDVIGIRRMYEHCVEVRGATGIAVADFFPGLPRIDRFLEPDISSTFWVATGEESVWIGRMGRETHEIVAAAAYAL